MCDKGFTKSGNFTTHKQSPTKVKLLSYDLLKPTEAKLFNTQSGSSKIILQWQQQSKTNFTVENSPLKAKTMIWGLKLICEGINNKTIPGWTY